jgi:hypothetical protein
MVSTARYQRNEARRGAVRSAAGLRASYKEARAPKPTERLDKDTAYEKCSSNHRR